ncbi:hypothetical protein Cni_G13761 [Canna indica]|uniref:ENT domain-containing protein n=1 Tax=Canna indica TaxID=4628 RepID=A0AAQ3QDC2_9LILI|nr:hypothetical protein Cni_G13761 [Canna indica]
MKFKEGNLVEVYRRKEEQYGSWFPAKVLLLQGLVYTVRYDLFLTADGRPVVEAVNKEDVRPSPPPLNHKENWNVGDVAEVFDLFSWKVGKVMKVLKSDRVVIKPYGSIQIKVHYLSDLRIPQAWQNGQWVVVNKQNGKKLFHDCIQSTVNSTRMLDSGTTPGINQQAPNGCRSKQKHVAYSSTFRTIKRILDSQYCFPPTDLASGRIDKKRKSSITLPKEVDVNSFLKDMALLHKSSRGRIARCPQMNADKDYTYNHFMNASAVPFANTGDNDESSVASCSGREYPVCSYQNLRKPSKRAIFTDLDDAASPCPLQGQREYQSNLKEKFAATVHSLELQAYQSTMQAFHAYGPLSWEQESLLTNLRLCLNISNEEHLLQLRHMLST